MDELKEGTEVRIIGEAAQRGVPSLCAPMGVIDSVEADPRDAYDTNGAIYEVVFRDARGNPHFAWYKREELEPVPTHSGSDHAAGSGSSGAGGSGQ